MRHAVKKKLFFAAATSTGLLGLVGYPAVKSDITPIDKSHWLLLSLLKSHNPARREQALNELARQRRWNDAECLEIAQALDRQDIIKLSRTVDADLRLFLPPPSVEFIERTLNSSKIEKLVKTILKNVAEKADSCSSCTNFYTNLSIRVRPDPNVLAMSDLNQVDKMLRIESRKRKKSAYNEDIIKLKAVLNNVTCGEEQAKSMAQSGMLVALLYFCHKYQDDVQINGLLAQILANLSVNESTRDYLFTNGWIQMLTRYSRSEHLELSLPAFKALVNLDQESRKINGVYGNHIYLLSPFRRDQSEVEFDVVFIHGLVGSVFKSWRQGSIILDESGNQALTDGANPATEPSAGATRCWPKDWLPEDVPGLRVLAVDYPTALSGWRTDCDLNKDSLKERAIHVMKQLEDARLGDRPIIWVAHSMGGLLVKQILVLCETKATEFRKNLLEQSNGIIFYSVPHKGSNLDWIERKNLQKLLLLTTEVIELQKGSPVLIDLHERFLKLARRNERLKFLTFLEDSISSFRLVGGGQNAFPLNKVAQWKGVLVHEESLQFEIGPNYKLDIDHPHTCKPHSKDAITYTKTLDFIKSIVPTKENRVVEDLVPFISFILS